jgi:intein-encoded DNA endonuclease-like protein
MPFKRKNNFNQDYFKVIDTEDRAYFLGLLYADGNVYMKRNRVQITLSNSDSYILDKLSEVTQSTAKLYIDRVKYSKVILESKTLCEDIIKLGCTPNKSLTLQFPTEEQVPSHLLHHFIRGYFDGDGHVSLDKKLINPYYHINMTSSKEFIETLKDTLAKVEISTGTSYKRYKEKEQSAHTVFVKNKNAKQFFDYIYKDATIYLHRKHDIFICNN